MIYDKETNHWYLNESHMKHSKAALRSNALLQKRLPLSREEAAANHARWLAMGAKNAANIDNVVLGK